MFKVIKDTIKRNQNPIKNVLLRKEQEVLQNQIELLEKEKKEIEQPVRNLEAKSVVDTQKATKLDRDGT